MDLSDIKIIVQWKAKCDLCSLWQRFGRAVRGGDKGFVFLLVEAKDTDEDREKKARAKERRKKKKEGKRNADTDLGGPLKRQASGSDTSTRPQPNGEAVQIMVEQPALLTTAMRGRGGIGQKGKTLAKGGVVVGSVLDRFINAGHRSRPDQCRRQVAATFFGNLATREYAAKHIHDPLTRHIFSCRYPQKL